MCSARSKATMLADVEKKLKVYANHGQWLLKIMSETNRSLEDISNSVLKLRPIIQQEFNPLEVLSNLHHQLQRKPTVLLFGQSCHAKALLLNDLFEDSLFPLNCNQWRQITIKYGPVKGIRLTLNQEIEIVECLKAHQTNDWTTIPPEDLRRNDNENLLEYCPSIELMLNHSLLKDGFKIIIPAECHPDLLPDVVRKLLNNTLPVILYAVHEGTLNDIHIQEIRKLKDLFPVPFLFVSVNESNPPTDSLTESEKELVDNSSYQKETHLHSLKQQLIRLALIYTNEDITTGNAVLNRTKSFCLECPSNNTLCSLNTFVRDFILFTYEVLKSSIIKMAVGLSEIHNACLRQFFLCAFDMAREIQITPRRILYVQDVEMQMYTRLMNLAGEQHDEITLIIQKTLQDMKSNVAEVLEGYQCSVPNSPKVATIEIQQLVLKRLGDSVAAQIVQSVGCLQESFTGTLQRCLENLESSCRELEGDLSASDALKMIMHSAYNIDLKSPTSFSIMQTFMDKLRTLMGTLASPWSCNGQFQCTMPWQLQVVTNMIESLTANKLAKTISTQFQERVKSSHEAFQLAIRNIEHELSDQLEKTEEHRIAIRKRHAPRFARLALQSASLRDFLKYGMPKAIREIGRGQYGVVSSCEPWGKVNPCAFKSVVPPDDRHWRDLAMEFYYTRTIPEHPRIVKLRGSVIDYKYEGSSPAVLLIMERMTRDLYSALKTGMTWLKRLRIAIDVIEGIRYLHSQGLVHRDIKLKNVLLDNDDRAKLTDFGFCIPEAMMSGSIVGTPIHMAPELLSGKYDSSVDVYAFGILFWYLCSGHINLPSHFDQFHDKEQLWNSVRKGLRPECLDFFDESCWKLMQQCWAAETAERPLLGNVQPQLEQIYEAAQAAQEANQDSFVVIRRYVN